MNYNEATRKTRIRKTKKKRKKETYQVITYYNGLRYEREQGE